MKRADEQVIPLSYRRDRLVIQAITVPSVDRVTVLVASGQPMVIRGLTSFLDPASEISSVTEADTNAEVMQQVRLHRPDVLVLDLDSLGMAVCQHVRRSASATRILIFTAIAESETVAAAIRAGASGYILKDAGQDEVRRAIRCVAAGEVILGANVVNSVGHVLLSPPVDPVFPTLTARERQILAMVAAGMSKATIANQLSLSLKTVSNYLSSVLTKLRVPDRTAAIARAREAGLDAP